MDLLAREFTLRPEICWKSRASCIKSSGACPRRIGGDHVRSIAVDMSVRNPRRWTKKAKEALSELLYIQGNVDWTFTLEPAGRISPRWTHRRPIRHASLLRCRRRDEIDAVVLFIAGLDSTSGLASLRGRAGRYLLAAYYSGNLEKQRAIASALGYRNLIQIQAPWTSSGETPVGGQFWYRSFPIFMHRCGFGRLGRNEYPVSIRERAARARRPRPPRSIA